MRARIIAIALALGVAFAMFAAQPSASKKATTKKPATKSTAKTTKSKSTAKTKGKTVTASKQKAKQAAPRRQTQPTSDRYKEIQQVLADKGYFNGSVDGSWGTDSIDALKRFQRDQNIGDDGKLGSLSLIALGLGPKRDLTSTCPTAPCGRGAVTEPRP